MKSDLVDIACEIRSNIASKQAIAIADGTMEKSEHGEREKWFWLPRSQVEINPDGTVTIPEWLAIDKGLV